MLCFRLKPFLRNGAAVMVEIAPVVSLRISGWSQTARQTYLRATGPNIDENINTDDKNYFPSEQPSKGLQNKESSAGVIKMPSDPS